MRIETTDLRVSVCVAALSAATTLAPFGSIAAPASVAAPSAPRSSDWAVDPTAPGENIPPVGRSLFDFLVTRTQGDRKRYDVPFPFPALLKKMETELQTGGTGNRSLKGVLIPLGRSLQRASAAPEFFAFPRVVVVADTEPAFSPAQAGMLIKDRVYLGYQEKANVIEVISYNEAAGRFEFQVVKNYRAGGNPRVFYANRAVCSACHQNAAPLFSRQVWDETNANPRITALLRKQRIGFYGIPADRGVDVPYAIDNATDRANLYAAYQLLWRAACAAQGDPAAARRCRASLYTAALQYRLSGKQAFDDKSAAYRRHVVAVFAAAASARWPAGLRIPNPDIPNRDPFLPRTASLAMADLSGDTRNDTPNSLAENVDVLPAFDPLNARPPLESWSLSDPAVLSRLVAGLSEFLAEPDARRLDTHLHRLAMEHRAPKVFYTGDCEVRRTSRMARRYRVDFHCPDRSASGERAASMRGRFYVDGRTVTGGALDHIQLIDDATARNELTDIDIASGTLVRRGTRWSATLALARAGRHVRRGDGNTVESMQLTWPDAAGRENSDRAILSGRVVVTVVQDFAPVQVAIEGMMQGTASGKLDVFSDQPFRRARLMPALFERLGMRAIGWCCVDDAGMPPALMESHTTVADAPNKAEAKPPELQPFYRYCATCHQSMDRSPPNFLQGSASEVAANLAHCAQRLYVRLSMWQVASAQRPKTAMPPDYALYGFHVTPEQWRESAELAALRAYVERALAAEHGKAPRVDDLLGRGYENLRACLPRHG